MKELTAENFDQETAEGIVLIDFWAEWCGPCKMMTPVLEEVSEEVGDRAKICKVNAMNEQDLTSKFNVRALPTFILMKNGEVIGSSGSVIGARSKQDLLDLIVEAEGE
jgi:thioredoxin 1